MVIYGASLNLIGVEKRRTRRETPVRHAAQLDRTRTICLCAR